MVEKLTLSAPLSDNPAPGITRTVDSFVVTGISFRIGITYDNATGAATRVPEGSFFEVWVAADKGVEKNITLWTDQEAFDAIKAINKLSTKSLEKRALERLVTLGYAGSIAGAVE